MRTLVMTLAAVAMLAAPAVGNPKLAGTWRSTPEQLSLTTDFDRSVWGDNAKSVRTVDLTLKGTGEGTLTVTRKVLDAKGRAVAGSTSIEEAKIVVGEPQPAVHGRVEYEVKVVSGERRYPDDPGYTWPLDGLKVRVASFEDGDGSIEVRFETPEGKGSFWETLRRGSAPATRRAAR